MFEDGYQQITNVDISFTVIKQMQEYYKEMYWPLENIHIVKLHKRCLQLHFVTAYCVIFVLSFSNAQN